MTKVRVLSHSWFTSGSEGETILYQKVKTWSCIHEDFILSFERNHLSLVSNCKSKFTYNCHLFL